MGLSVAVQDCIDRALKDELKLGDGRTTKQSVLLRFRSEARKRGLEVEVQIAAENQMILSGIDRSMKRGLPDNVIGLAFRNAPPALVQAMKYLPKCIAVGEGHDAEWVDSLTASATDWRANASLKAKKAAQTKAKANDSLDVARFMEEYGMGCLGDAVDVEEAA